MIFNYSLKNYNFRIVIYMIFLSVAGILVLRSASGGDPSIVGKQILGVAVSFVCTLIYAGCVALLAAVLLTGHSSGGATRWLKIFGFTFSRLSF